MPNYETHLSVGAALGFIIGSSVYGLFEPVLPFDIAFMAAVVAFEATCIGSILPDIDLHNSKPRKLLNGSLILGSGGAAYAHIYFKIAPKLPDPDAAHVLGAAAAFFVLLITGVIVPPAVQALTPKHREVLHNPALYLAVFLAPGYGLWHQLITLPSVDPAIEIVFIVPALVALFFGVLTHLFLDYPTWDSERHRYMGF